MELAAPKTVAQHDHRRSAGTKIGGKEPTAGFGGHAEEGHGVAGDFEREEILGVGDAGEREFLPTGSGGLREGGNAGAQESEIDGTETGGLVLAIEGLNFDDPLRIAEGDGMEKGAIDDAEEGDVGGGSDGKDGDDEERHVGIFAKAAQNLSEVCRHRGPFSRFAP